MASSQDIYHIGRPFFCIVKSLGLACYTLDYKTKCLITTCFDKFLLVFALSLWLVTSWLQVNNVSNVEYDSLIESQLIDSVWYYQFILTHFFGFGLVVFSFRQKSVIEKFLKSIFDIDKKLKSLGWHFKSQTKLFNIVVFTYVACFLGNFFFATVYAIQDEWLQKYSVITIAFNMFESSYVLLFYLVVAQKFIICVFIIRDRLTTVEYNMR